MITMVIGVVIGGGRERIRRAVKDGRERGME